MKPILEFLTYIAPLIVMFVGVRDNSIPAVLFGGMVLIAEAIREGKK